MWLIRSCATCKGCGKTYFGETSQNAYTRGFAHVGTVTCDLPLPPKTDGREKPKPTLRHHVYEVHKMRIQDRGVESVWGRCCIARLYRSVKRVAR